MPTKTHVFSTPKQPSSLVTDHCSQVFLTFSAKERDTETGLSFFGSRYYSSDLSIWLSVDPQAAKYPNLSPFTYCANNPVKLVDPNGEDYEVVVDEANKTMTIKAVYYTANENKGKIQEGLDNWNSLSGKYSYVTGNGKDRQSYTINFELTLAEGDFKTDDAARSAANIGENNSNNFVLFATTGGEKGATYYGKTIQIDPLKENPRTISHEIGHTLGMYDALFDSNLMYSGGESNNVENSNIRQCIKGYHELNTTWGGSSTHIGKCTNKVFQKYHGKIMENQ